MIYFLKKQFIFIYIGLIFGISSIPGDGFIGDIHQFGIDKLFHFLEYFILGVITHLYVKDRDTKFRLLYLGILIVPVIDEYFVQHISGRTVDYLDFIANFIGLYAGIFIYLLLGKYFDKKAHN